MRQVLAGLALSGLVWACGYDNVLAVLTAADRATKAAFAAAQGPLERLEGVTRPNPRRTP